MKQLSWILIPLTLLVALACSGGSGGGSTPSSTNVNIRMKPSEILPHEQGSTFLITELGGEGKTILPRTEYTGDPNQSVEVEFEADKSYVLIMEVRGMPFLRTTLLASQIKAAQSSGVLNIGTINAVTTYMTGLLEVQLNQGRQASGKETEASIQTFLKENFGDSATDFSALSYDNIKEGTTTFTSDFTQHMNRINFMRLYFHAVRNTDENLTDAQKGAMTNLYTALFDETKPENLLEKLSAPDLPPLAGGESFTSIVDTLSSQGVFLQGDGVLSPTELGAAFFDSKNNPDLLLSLVSNPTGIIAGSVSGMTSSDVEIKITGQGSLSLSKTVTSDANGNFRFDNMLEGSYVITPAKSSHVFDPPSQTITLSKAQAKTDLSFTALVDRGALSLTPSTENKTFLEGYYSSISVSGSSNLLPQNILNGITMFGVTGTATSLASNKVLYAGTSSGGNITVKYE